MIKPRELNLNNLVNCPITDQNPFRIDLFEYKTNEECKIGMNVHKYEFHGELIDGHALTWENKDLTGIPLTHYNLLDLGFIQDPLKTGDKSLFSIHGLCVRFVLEYYICNVSGVKLKYIHNLQNFFFDSTGRELDLSKLFKA